jgi:hypothetical protein
MAMTRPSPTTTHHNPRCTLTKGAARPVPMTVALVFTGPSSTPDSSLGCRALVRLRKPE